MREVRLVSPTHAFQACSLNRSDTSPHGWRAWTRTKILGSKGPCATDCTTRQRVDYHSRHWNWSKARVHGEDRGTDLSRRELLTEIRAKLSGGARIFAYRFRAFHQLRLARFDELRSPAQQNFKIGGRQRLAPPDSHGTRLHSSLPTQKVLDCIDRLARGYSYDRNLSSSFQVNAG